MNVFQTLAILAILWIGGYVVACATFGPDSPLPSDHPTGEP